MACKCFEEQRLLRRAVGQWRRNEVHRAVRIWEDEYIKWLKGRLALNRMMNAGLTKALNAWVEGWRAGREARRKQRLEQEKTELLDSLKPKVPQRQWRKLIVPIDKYPGYNFFGAIIGPRGSAQKRMEK